MLEFGQYNDLVGLHPCRRGAERLHARRIPEPFRVLEPDGTVQRGRAGDYLVRGPDADLRVVAAADFEHLYTWSNDAMNDTATAYDRATDRPEDAPDPASATWNDIEHLAKRYAHRRGRLRVAVDALEDEIRHCKRKHLPAISECAGHAITLRDRLRACVEAHPEYFRQPKTIVLHNIRIGYKKKPDAVEWDDDREVCARIERHLPEQFGVLIIRPPPAPVKKALLRLNNKLLTKLGVRKIPGADEVIVKPTDSEVDKLVDKLLETTDDPREAAE